MLGVLAFAAVFLAENAVIGMALGQEPPHRRLRRPIGHRDRVEVAAAELVLDVEARAEIGQDRPAGDVGQFVEEGDEIIGGVMDGHACLPATGGSPQGCARAVDDASADMPRTAP